jgi:hypothetical protein
VWGMEKRIKIWSDKWLMTPTSYKVQSPVSILNPDARVSELISGDTGWWNTQLIHSIFNKSEAESICSLAISPQQRDDKLIWSGTKNGFFTVRSVYHMEKARSVKEKGECSKKAIYSEVWKKIWKLKVPGVKKNFLWKVGNNILPTKENLYKKKITQDPLCPICGLFSESVGHILWSCSSSVAVWQECSRRIQKLSFM